MSRCRIWLAWKTEGKNVFQQVLRRHDLLTFMDLKERLEKRMWILYLRCGIGMVGKEKEGGGAGRGVGVGL